MSDAAAGKLLAQALLHQAHAADRRRLARIIGVGLLILLTTLYPCWLFATAALAAIIRMAVLNRRDALANAVAIDLLLFASEPTNDKEHPDD